MELKMHAHAVKQTSTAGHEVVGAKRMRDVMNV